MRILIGGSPSTGSSVFRQILNRHPKVFCGPETNLFCYPQLYRNWKTVRRRMFLPGILGLHKTDVRTIRGLHMCEQEGGWTMDKVKTLMRAHRSFPSFCEAYFARPLERYGKTYWAEKTPANVLQFRAFMKSFEESYIIHTVRSPYDTVASLVARGMTAYEAASVYLLYTAHGLIARGMHGYLDVRYESLVEDPAATMDSGILQPLGLEFGEAMLEEGNPEVTGVTRMPGWRSDEMASISNRSRGRYLDESEEMQALIATALMSVCISKRYMDRHRLEYDTIEKICAVLEYPSYQDKMDERFIIVLRQDRKRILKQQWLYRVVSATEEYPIVINP